MGSLHENEQVDARRVAAVMREITMDATRAFLAAVPAVLQEEQQLAPDQAARLTQLVIVEAMRRFMVNVSATLATLD
jgi:hypothetical protein